MRTPSILPILSLLAACAGDREAALTLGELREVSPEVAIDGDFRTTFGRDPHTPLGPMAVLADGDGFALLDQEQKLLRRYDAAGEALGTVDIPRKSTLDAAALPLGDGFALLAYDREAGAQWSVQTVDERGSLGGDRAVPQADVPSAVFAVGDSVLVEQAHDWLVDLDSGAVLPGRPDGAGRYVRAQKDGPRQLTLTWQDAEGGDVERVVLTTDRTLSSVTALEPRPDHTMVAMVLYTEGHAPAFDMLRPEVRVLVLDSGGSRLDEFSLEAAHELDVARPLALGRDGDLYQLRTTDHRLEIDRVEVRR